MSVAKCLQCDHCKRLEPLSITTNPRSESPEGWYKLSNDPAVEPWDFCKAECLFWWMRGRQEAGQL